MSETIIPSTNGQPKALPTAIASVLVTERRRENLMIAEALRERARNGPAAALLHHGSAALKGFLAGAAVIFPVVIWSSGVLTERGANEPPAVLARQAGVVGGVVPLLVRAPEPARQVELPDRSEEQRREWIEQTLARSRELLTAKLVPEARQALSDPEVQASPEGAFALAETYDPNVLAAQNIRGVNAEVDHARRLYTTALIGGIESARQRLAALQ